MRITVVINQRAKMINRTEKTVFLTGASLGRIGMKLRGYLPLPSPGLLWMRCLEADDARRLMGVSS